MNLFRNGLNLCLWRMEVSSSLNWLDLNFLTYSVVTFDIIRKTRNDIVHNPNCPANSTLFQDIVKRIELTAQAHWKIQLSDLNSEGKKTSNTWNLPPKNWVKINTDVKFINGVAQSTFIIKNHKGSVIFGSSRKHVFWSSCSWITSPSWNLSTYQQIKEEEWHFWIRLPQCNKLHFQLACSR